MPPVTNPNSNPPEHLSDAAKKAWIAAYAKALSQAKIDNPNNVSAQRAIALKAANALLAVPAPQSAADIDKLNAWQVLRRETRTLKDGQQVLFCVTADGRKYSFPLAASAKSNAANGAKSNVDDGAKDNGSETK